MLRTCIAKGLAAARGYKGLAALLWFWSLLLGVLAAFPAWFWLGQGFDLRPESDRLLTGFNMSVFMELLQYDRSPVFRSILAAALGVLALALVANPFVSGGLLAALRGGNEESSPARRFWQGGAFYYWRFLRLLIYGAVTVLPLMAIAGGAFSPLVEWFDNRPWEPGTVLGRLFPAAAVLLTGAWGLLALDLARVRMVLEKGRGPLRNWFWALLCVLRHPVTTFGLLAAMAGLFAVVAAIYSAVAWVLPPSAWAAILTVVVLQQAVMFLRSSLRISLVAGEITFCDNILPPPRVATEPLPEPAVTEPEAESPEPHVGAAPPEDGGAEAPPGENPPSRSEN